MTVRTSLALLLSSLAISSGLAAEVTLGERTIQIPDGYEIEIAAAAPLVERPISIARDERGRLYVTDSAGMSDRADKQLELKPHRIRRLEDRDGDGRYDHSVVFAERMMFPEGCLWRDGSLYVAAPPQIWKLTDADDDGRAESREAWFDGGTLTGCGNDLHGPYLGRDGWIYWCKGAFAEQKHKLANGKELTTRAGHIFRARPDGSGLEPVLTGGMDNPVGVAFHSTGERFLSCTFFQNPEAGRRDGLIHAIYGGVYGKKHDPIESHKKTGDVMPVLVHEGAAAPCGLIAASDSLFAGATADHLLACYFNLHKVVDHTLIPEGPTFRTQDRDLVACEHPDFHPTDVFEDADGSLLVVDTGGWYKVCCPTSQLAKPDVLGAIYRLRKTGAKRVDDPLGKEIAWDSLSPRDLASLLADDPLFVQRGAEKRLRKLGEPAVSALRDIAQNHENPAVRQRAVWALSGIDAPTAREAVRGALADRDAGVIHAAAHVASVWRDREAFDGLTKLLASDDAALVRVAAEALGRLGDPRAVQPLLEAVSRLPASSPDAAGAPASEALRIREHSLIYAIIEIGDPQTTAAGLTSPNSQVRRAALVALDQMENGGLQPAGILPLLDDDDPILRNTATWIVGHRAEWGDSLVAHFQGRLAGDLSQEADQAEVAAQLAKLGKSPAIQELLASTLNDAKHEAAHVAALRAMREARLTETPPAWLDEVARSLGASRETVLAQAVESARALPLPKGGHAELQRALNAVGRQADVPVEVRFAALVAAGQPGELEADLFEELLKHVAPRESHEVRSNAAAILATAALSDEQRLALIEMVEQVGPLELPKLLPAFEREPNETAGLKLVAALEKSAGLRGLRTDLLRPLLEKYPPSVQEAGQKLLAQLNVSAADQAAFLGQLLTQLPPGDLRRGHEVFVGKKSACSSCHAVGYLGGRLGPDLTSLGKVRTERDLLESIIYPSASFVRSYEPMRIELEDGRTATGIVVSENAEEIVLATDPLKTLPIARREIAEMQPSNVSLMPQGFANLLNPQELADLLAYLKQASR